MRSSAARTHKKLARSDIQAVSKQNACRLPHPMVGIVGGLNAEKPVPPSGIVLEPDVFDDERELPLRRPLPPPRLMRLLQRLAQRDVLNLIRRWKQTDHG